MHDTRVNIVLAESDIVEKYEKGEISEQNAIIDVSNRISQNSEMNWDGLTPLKEQIIREALTKPIVRNRGVFERGDKVEITGVLVDSEHENGELTLKIRDNDQRIRVHPDSMRKNPLNHSLFGVIEKRKGNKYYVNLDANRETVGPLSGGCLSGVVS